MANLLDIAVSLRHIKTQRYGEVAIHGLSIEGIAHLIKNHPELVEIFDDGGKDFTADYIITLGVDVLANFLAAGLGYPGNPEAVERCKDMNAEDAFNIGQAILEESFPGGAKSFFEKVAQAARHASSVMTANQAKPQEGEKVA